MGKKRKSKRNRTTFTDEQIHILQANFQLDCNPDGQDLERIADISGLSKRVVQVWFHNARGQHASLCSENTLDLNIAFSAFYSSSSPENEHETGAPPPPPCFSQPPQV